MPSVLQRSARRGFDHRISLQTFLSHYQCISTLKEPMVAERVHEDRLTVLRERCVALCAELLPSSLRLQSGTLSPMSTDSSASRQPQLYEVGKTKIFLRGGVIAYLERKCAGGSIDSHSLSFRPVC